MDQARFTASSDAGAGCRRLSSVAPPPPPAAVVMEYKTCNFDHWFRIHDGAEQLIYEARGGFSPLWAPAEARPKLYRDLA